MNIKQENLKKLLLYGILHDSREKLPPITIKEQKDIIENFSKADQDEMSLALQRQVFEEGKLFSQDAFEKFLLILRLFVGSRVLGNYNKTNKEPEVLLVNINIEHLTHKEYNERKLAKD